MSVRAVYRELSNFDYYYRADDDTYAFVENLFALLKKLNTTEVFMTGYRFTHEPLSNHFDGGAGYVFPREVLKRLVEQSIGRHDKCPSYEDTRDDLFVCACAKAVGVPLVDSLDEGGRPLFYYESVAKYFETSRPSSTEIISDNPFIRRKRVSEN
ncbi:unnamed protein product [Calicophoron daubneyi]|uniref:N-acetylgalactosaminide beta-1,3-galactosyltransferase n=1 Tax=Calicophoron daubneyi TaxID=300641 RepID=A0AAV2T541_CALDB